MAQGKISPPPDNLDKSTRLLNWEDRTGHRFGRLLVIGWAGRGPWGKSKRRNWWTCQCDCGTVTSLVLTKHRISCGCRQRETRKLGPMYQRKGLMDKIEAVTGKRLTIQQCCRLYHIKYAALRARLYRFPDSPEKWGLKRRKPPSLRNRKPDEGRPAGPPRAQRFRLHDDAAQAIREASGTHRGIAARLGVSRTTVSRIKSGKW